MTPQNLRSMFAVSAELCEKALNNEVVELGNAIEARKNLEFMLKCHEQAHKQTVANCEYGDSYTKNWQQINPQTKTYDALPE